MESISRRDFARTAGVATAVSYSRILGANDRVRMGYIGLGNRGDQVHDAFLEHGDQQTVAVCDLRDDYMDFAVKKSRATPKRYKDYRKLLEDKNVDAVVIATPDHWHALMFIDACHAGKDVYVEKPLSLTVVEGRKMVEVAGETKRVTQVGIHRRSVQVAAGSGRVRAQRRHRPGHRGQGLPRAERVAERHRQSARRPAAQREGMGPVARAAPKVPYNRNRTYYNFRWFYDYSGGQLTNFGVHYMDMIRWCLGKEAPRAVTAMGGQYAVKDNREIPDTCEVLWDFGGHDGDLLAVQRQRGAGQRCRNAEMEIRGTKGTMYLHSGRWEVVPESVTETLFGYAHAARPRDREGLRARRRSRPSSRKSVKGGPTPAFARAQFPGLRQEPREVQLRHPDRPPLHLGHPDRQHRPPDQELPGVGRQGGAVHQQRGGQQVPELPVPRAVQAGLSGAGRAPARAHPAALRTRSSRCNAGICGRCGSGRRPWCSTHRCRARVRRRCCT